ncbi:hypothetical protein MLD38_011514 [Melastoma candidum]|uniref:Uncharacterized protein n=1 Tax=Melastoma candidum TaxID=119954 RepID=A0ACB9R6U1_9MYRT|nr:hypothetical protein MLD38_011514 [Melastoma candidum]
MGLRRSSRRPPQAPLHRLHFHNHPPRHQVLRGRVFLSTSLVHVLPDAFDALGDCKIASLHPWRDFPFAGLVTLVGAVLALLVDAAASSHVENGGHGHGHGHGARKDYKMVDMQEEEQRGVKIREEVVVLGEDPETTRLKEKQRLVSQVLEIGIIFHSVIIGVTMGMSQNKCSIRPLVSALAFHQFFQGMGLGGCIAQVEKGTKGSMRRRRWKRKEASNECCACHGYDHDCSCLYGARGDQVNVKYEKENRLSVEDAVIHCGDG